MSDKSNAEDNPLEQTRDSIFSNVVTVISGARQSAQEEFSRFWDQFSQSTGPVTSQARVATSSKPRNRVSDIDTHGAKKDSPNIGSKTIHGRVVPDNHRGEEYFKDAEIQTEEPFEEEKAEREGTFSIKRKASSISEDNSNTPVRPQKVSRRESPSQSTLPNSARESPIHSTPTPAQYSPIRTPTSTQYSPAKSPLSKLSPRRSPPVRSSPIRSSPIRSSPIRSSPDNRIQTGSAKSVRRLTFELEEAFSPRFPVPVGQPKKYTAVQDNSDPFNSTPLIKDNANDITPVENSNTTTVENISTTTVENSNTTTIKKRNLFEEDDIPDSQDNTEVIPSSSPKTDKTSTDKDSLSNDSDGETFFSRFTSTTYRTASLVPKAPSRKLSQEEEDRRLEELERNVSSIKSQMDNYVSYPNIIRSPVPSHTVASEVPDTSSTTLKDTPPKESKKIFSPVKTPSTYNSPIRSTTSYEKFTSTYHIPASNDKSSSPVKASPTIRSTTPVRSTTHIRSTTPIRVSPVRASTPPRTPYSRPSKVSTSRYTPPATLAPASNTEIPRIFSPTKDIPNAVLTKRLGLSRNHSQPNSIDGNRFAPFLGHNITSTTNDKKIKPTDEHKSSMRELIQLIPGVKLRKTDKLIGPDGKERPNPFWNEIYNRRGGRKAY